MSVVDLPCRHCGKPPTSSRRVRGLCWSCIRKPELLAVYPPLPRKRCEGFDDDPTEAELEAVIAEQLQNLPDWWEADCEQERVLERELRVYTLVKCA